MWNPLNRAPKPKSEEGPKLTQTSTETLELLTERARRVAETVGVQGDKISEADIKQAAFREALAAERAGHPYTEAEIAAEDSDTDMRLAGAFGDRIKARPEASHVIVDDQGNVTTAANKSEALDKIGKARDNEDAPRV